MQSDSNNETNDSSTLEPESSSTLTSTFSGSPDSDPDSINAAGANLYTLHGHEETLDFFSWSSLKHFLIDSFIAAAFISQETHIKHAL